MEIPYSLWIKSKAEIRTMALGQYPKYTGSQSVKQNSIQTLYLSRGRGSRQREHTKLKEQSIR